MSVIVDILFTPILIAFLLGGIYGWYVTREALFIVMALGMLPTLLEIPIMWYSPFYGGGFSETGEVMPPEEAQILLAEAMGWFKFVGKLASSLALFVLISKYTKHVRSGT